MNVTIREAELSDLSRLVELYKLLDFYPEEEQPFDKLQQQFMRHEEYPDYHVFVAEVGNIIVGTFALIVIESAAHGGGPGGGGGGGGGAGGGRGGGGGGGGGGFGGGCFFVGVWGGGGGGRGGGAGRGKIRRG